MTELQDITKATRNEVETYLDTLEWDTNPFTGTPASDEYVIPDADDIAELAVHIDNYAGILLIHSKYSGVGKSTLLNQLLDDYSDSHTTAYINEHNVTPYELVSIVADSIGIGKSSSTKLTEDKIEKNISEDDDILIGVDEFGLNDPDTLHTIQFLNDAGCKVIITGMSSQYNAIGSLGPEGKAFQRRVALDVQLDPFTPEQTTELIEKRIQTVSTNSNTTHPFTPDAIDVIHTESKGVAGVVLSACNTLFTLGAYRHSQGIGIEITEEMAIDIEYADPVADE